MVPERKVILTLDETVEEGNIKIVPYFCGELKHQDVSPSKLWGGDLPSIYRTVAFSGNPFKAYQENTLYPSTIDPFTIRPGSGEANLFFYDGGGGVTPYAIIDWAEYIAHLHGLPFESRLYSDAQTLTLALAGFGKALPTPHQLVLKSGDSDFPGGVTNGRDALAAQLMYAVRLQDTTTQMIATTEGRKLGLIPPPTYHIQLPS